MHAFIECELDGGLLGSQLRAIILVHLDGSKATSAVCTFMT